MESKMKIFGHPIHPMLVAYPVAFYTATLVGFIVYAATGADFWRRLAIAANVGAVGMAVVAAIPGFIDWLLAIPRGTPARRTATMHMLLNDAALALFAVSLIMYAGDWNDATATAAPGIILAGAGMVFTMMAGFKGWALVQDHHVGVKEHTKEESLRANMRRAG